jgi:hypothetical protein
MTKNHRRRAARPLATGVIARSIMTTPCIILPMKLEPSSLFADAAWQIDVGEKSRFEQRQPDVEIEITPDEHRVLQAAHVALTSLRRSFDDWIAVGRGLQLLRQKADQIGARAAFNELREQHRLGDKYFRKETVSRLLRIMDHLQAVQAWRLTLNEKLRIDWASPDTIVRRCPIFNKPKTATAEAKLSPYRKLAQANAELQTELHDLKPRVSHGDPYGLKNDSVETIARTIIDKVGIDKAVKIARAILNSPQHDEWKRAERELAEHREARTERTRQRAQRGAGTKKPKA